MRATDCVAAESGSTSLMGTDPANIGYAAYSD
jgi:hypothetical protein